MKALINALLSRRSIRKFTPEAVTAEDREAILAAALAAPSACNFRPVHLVVLEDRQTIDRFAEIHKFAAMAKGAPLVVAVCAETNLSTISSHYWRDDASAAMENLLLAAHCLGYGAVWCGGIIHTQDHEERHGALRKLLNLPENVEPLGYAVIGRPDEVKPAYPASGDESKIHRGSW